MSAKEMFEKLGYIQNSDNLHIFINGITYYHINDKEHIFNMATFNGDKGIHIDAPYSKELMEAIQQQIKELEW